MKEMLILIFISNRDPYRVAAGGEVVYRNVCIQTTFFEENCRLFQKQTWRNNHRILAITVHFDIKMLVFIQMSQI